MTRAAARRGSGSAHSSATTAGAQRINAPPRARAAPRAARALLQRQSARCLSRRRRPTPLPRSRSSGCGRVRAAAAAAAVSTIRPKWRPARPRMGEVAAASGDGCAHTRMHIAVPIARRRAAVPRRLRISARGRSRPPHERLLIVAEPIPERCASSHTIARSGTIARSRPRIRRGGRRHHALRHVTRGATPMAPTESALGLWGFTLLERSIARDGIENWSLNRRS